MGAVAILALLSGVPQAAYAKRNTNSPRVHFKMNKHAGLFGGNYLKPKKQKKPTGYYRSTMTGKTVYGKPKN
jgi:hypothetical protein